MAKSGDSKIAEIIRNRFNKLHSAQVEIFDEVETYHAMYRSAMTQDEGYPWEFQYVDPQIFPLMRNTLARLDPKGMNIYLEPREEMDKKQTDINQQLVNWELDENEKFMILYRFIFRGLLAGRTYLGTGWKYEPAVEIETEKGLKKVLHQIVNHAEVKNIRFQDMFIPNRNIPILQEQPYIIERVSMRFGDMLDENEDQGKEVWKKDILEYIKSKKVFSTKMDYGVDLINEDGDGKEEKLYRSRYVSLLKMQTKDGDCFYILEDASSKNDIINTETGNQYLHNHYNYIDWAPFPEDDEYFSLGVVQPVADLQEALSSTLNQQLTTARNAANPMTVVNESNSQTPDWTFVRRPNGVMRIKGDVNQVRELTGADANPILIPLRQELQRTFERASSMSSLYTSGVATGAAGQINTTAKGAQVINSNIDTNMQLLVSIFSAMALKKIGEHFLELNSQYITEEQIIKVTGKDGMSQLVKVDPAEVTANFDVKVSEESMIKQTPEMRQATLINIYTTLLAEKEVKLDRRPLIKALLETNPDTEDLAGDVLHDVEAISNENISLLMKGVLPEVKMDDDHQTLIMLAQKHLLDMPDMPDGILQLFNQYMQELRKWISAANPNFLKPPPPVPQLLPSNQEDLMSAMSQGMGVANQNPTAGQPVTIPQENLGMGMS